jgi:hypothetical protein
MILWFGWESKEKAIVGNELALVRDLVALEPLMGQLSMGFAIPKVIVNAERNATRVGHSIVIKGIALGHNSHTCP